MNPEKFDWSKKPEGEFEKKFKFEEEFEEERLTMYDPETKQEVIAGYDPETGIFRGNYQIEELEALKSAAEEIGVKVEEKPPFRVEGQTDEEYLSMKLEGTVGVEISFSNESEYKKFLEIFEKSKSQKEELESQSQ